MCLFFVDLEQWTIDSAVEPSSLKRETRFSCDFSAE